MRGTRIASIFSSAGTSVNAVGRRISTYFLASRPSLTMSMISGSVALCGSQRRPLGRDVVERAGRRLDTEMNGSPV